MRLFSMFTTANCDASSGKRSAANFSTNNIKIGCAVFQDQAWEKDCLLKRYCPVISIKSSNLTLPKIRIKKIMSKQIVCGAYTI